ncbi:MAG: ABC transporter ATP-binding protein [Rhizobiales bacterium]|nr:ABC transporter ATP-binding protein [Hyphomicrobiales bacterium]
MFRFFERLVDPYPPDAPAMPPRGLVAFAWHYSRPVAPWLLMMAVFTAVISVLELVFFAFLGNLVDWLTAADRATFYAEYAARLWVMGLLTVVAFPAATLIQSLFMFQTIFANHPMLIRWQAHRYLLGQSLAFFQNEFAGRVSQKVMQTALAVRDAVQKLLDVAVYVIVAFVGTLILVGQSDTLMLVPLVVWLAAYVAMLWYFIPRLQAVGERQADARSLMTGRVVDSYTNIQTIKLFAHTQREQGYVRSAMDDFMGTAFAQSRLITQFTFCLNVANSLLLFAVGGLAIMGWHESTLSLGAITIAVSLVLRIRSMSQWIMWEVAGLFENIGTIADGMNTIAQPVTVTDKPDAEALVVTKGEIAFDHARFHYGRKTKVLEDFSLTVKPGEKVGLVGRSGAGKSTLVNLLLRFYDLEGGRILIDGQDIAGVTQESLRRAIGMVTQDTSLLHRSVAENILYGRPEASREAMIVAAEQAEATEFIATLADPQGRTGYDAHVGERGVKLSGGQRQRIAIARVLLKDAPILILDEATSALDSEVEAAIQQSLYRLMAGKTVIAIAHRLSTIAAMDRLVVLDRGRIAEVGTHEALLRRDGLYAALWHRQSGGFLLDEAEQGEAAE